MAKTKLPTRYTERGFFLAEWRDRYGKDCSLQESSSAEVPSIWLGTGEERMHLTQEMVADILPYLKKFAKTGRLGKGRF